MNNGMLTQIDDGKTHLLTKKEEELFGNGLRRAMIHDRPNPDRVGCPDKKIIRDLAFRKKIGDAEDFGRIADHLAECSPCVQDTLVYAEEYRHKAKKRRDAFIAMGLAAAILLSVGLWALMGIREKPVAVEIPRSVPAPPANPAPVIEAHPPAKMPEIAQLELVTIELPMRMRGAGGSEKSIILPSGHLQLDVRLPLGSPEGKYKIRILNKAGNTLISAESASKFDKGFSRLSLPFDTSVLIPGTYILSILQPDLDEWINYSLMVLAAQH